MTKQEAKRQVCGAVATIIAGHIAAPAEYLEKIDGEFRSEEDWARMVEAAKELVMELERRSRKGEEESNPGSRS